MNALRAVRNELPAWAPPERDLGFTIVDRAQSAAPPRRWVMPAWGLAAAATLVLAAAAAIANVEIRYGADGLSVRTGWSRGGDVAAMTASAPTPVTAAPQAAWRAELTSLERRLREEFAAKEAVTHRAAAPTAAPEPEDVLRRVRTLIGAERDPAATRGGAAARRGSA